MFCLNYFIMNKDDALCWRWVLHPSLNRFENLVQPLTSLRRTKVRHEPDMSQRINESVKNVEEIRGIKDALDFNPPVLSADLFFIYWLNIDLQTNIIFVSIHNNWVFKFLSYFFFLQNMVFVRNMVVGL